MLHRIQITLRDAEDVGELSGYWVGTFFFIGGVALRWWSIIHLGRLFTVDWRSCIEVRNR